ncbi:expressed protein [Phakopsora pachyrhizi]|uniref:Expressed protein n=1 Tax=Phakopsora pachyrhizi TaxID=170000 RepID=A0AAV0AFQ2_PHAPC|nr:expressed protein [Phakopsora pachyrhizi]
MCFCSMALVSSAIILYLTQLIKYSQGTSGTIDLFDIAPIQIKTKINRATTSLDPLVLSGAQDKNWLSLRLLGSGDQPKAKTIEKSTRINHLSSNEKGELSILGKDLIQRHQLNEQIKSTTFRDSKHKNIAAESSSETLPKWPTRFEENELRPIGTAPRIIYQSAQTNSAGSTLLNENISLEHLAGPSAKAVEPTAYQLSESGTMNFFPKFTTHWALESGEIHPVFQLYDQKPFHISKNIRHEIDSSFQPSTLKYKNHAWTEDTTIMELEQIGGQTSQEVKDSLDVRSGSQTRFEKVNLELSLAPVFHETDPLSALGDTGKVLNGKAWGTIKSFENNQTTRKRKKNAAREASTKKMNNVKNKWKKYDTELSEFAFGHEGNKKGVVTMSRTKILTFEDALMELIAPEKPLIRTACFEFYLSKVENLQDDKKKKSITNVLKSIKERYSKIRGNIFT